MSLLLVEQQPRKLPIETFCYSQTTVSFVKVEGASVHSFKWVFIVYLDITVSGFSGLLGIFVANLLLYLSRWAATRAWS